ncbi:MAG: cysteine-rich CWC family protein [Rheinheimera sp.]
MSCPRCGTDNQCQMTSVAPSINSQQTSCGGDASCWCFQLVLTPEQRALLPSSSSCYCAACLDELVTAIPADRPSA